MSWPVLVLAGLLLLGGALALSRGRRCAVYEIPSRHPTRPLYIGVAYNPQARIARHRRSWWWRYAAGPPRWRWYRNRPEALAVERARISRRAPLINRQHNRGRHVRPGERIAA